MSDPDNVVREVLEQPGGTVSVTRGPLHDEVRSQAMRSFGMRGWQRRLRAFR